MSIEQVVRSRIDDPMTTAHCRAQDDVAPAVEEAADETVPQTPSTLDERHPADTVGGEDVLALLDRVGKLFDAGKSREGYGEIQPFLVAARGYKFARLDRGKHADVADSTSDREHRHLQAAIDAYPRARPAVERAEAAPGDTQVAATPPSVQANVKRASGASGAGEVALGDVADHDPHPLSPRIEVSQELLGDPAVHVQQDVERPAVGDAVADSRDEIKPEAGRLPVDAATQGIASNDTGGAPMEAAITPPAAISTPAAPAVPQPGGDSRTRHQGVVRVLRKVPRFKIRVDQSTQARAGINAEIVESYAEALRTGDELPPPDLVLDDDNDCFWTADGHHRILAHDKLHGDDWAYELEAMVRPGAHRDAVLLAVAANGDHGLQRTNADKRRAVMLMLEDAEWREWSDREIGRQCNVGRTLVAEVRRQSLGRAEGAQPRRFVTKHGTESTMRLKGGQSAADDAYHGGSNAAGVERPAGAVDGGDEESRPGSREETMETSTSPRATGDRGGASLAAAASEDGAGSLAAANGQPRRFCAPAGEGAATSAPTVADVKPGPGRSSARTAAPMRAPVAPTGSVASTKGGPMASPEATTLLGEMQRVTNMFTEARDALLRLGRQTASGELLPEGEAARAGITRRGMPAPYKDAVRMAQQLMDRLFDCEEALESGRGAAERRLGELAAGMGRRPAKSKRAHTGSGSTAKMLTATKAIQKTTKKVSTATKPSLAKTSRKSHVGSKNKKKGKARR